MSRKTLLLYLTVFFLILTACRTSVFSPQSVQPTQESGLAEETDGSGASSSSLETQPVTQQQSSVDTPDLPATEQPVEQAVVPEAANPLIEIIPLPPGPVVLIALGDSLTEGSGDYDSGIGFPGRLLDKINTLRPGSTLHNLGRSGWSSDDLIKGNQDGLSQLEEALKIAATAKAAGLPVLATVWIGSNDLWYLYEYGPDPMTVDSEDADVVNFRNNIRTILFELKAAGVSAFIAQGDDQSLRPVVANPPNPAEPAFPAISADDRQRMASQIRNYNLVIAELASQAGAGLVDFYHTSLFTDPNTLDGDGNHPNSTGYDMIADLWFGAIQPTLR